MRAITLLVALCCVVAAGCRGIGDDSGPKPTATATTAASGGDAVARETAEANYMRQLCQRDAKFAADREAIPEASQDPSSMTLAQRRARGEALWPALAGLYEGYVADMEDVTPPDSAAALHAALLDLNRSQARELRRSLAEFDAIFVSEDTLEANNDALRATEQAGMQAVDRALSGAPALLELYQTLPECGGNAAPDGTPAAEETPG